MRLLRLRAGIGSQLVGQQPPELLIGGKRLGLPPVRVERFDQEDPRPFPQRMHRRELLQLLQLLQLRHELGVLGCGHSPSASRSRCAAISASPSVSARRPSPARRSNHEASTAAGERSRQ